MFRFANSKALVAGLLATTALATAVVTLLMPARADEMPLDSLPFGNIAHPRPAAKKPVPHIPMPVAARVPGVGELVPLQMPGAPVLKQEAGVKAHHHKPSQTASENLASVSQVPRVTTYPTPYAAVAASAAPIKVAAAERVPPELSDILPAPVASTATVSAAVASRQTTIPPTMIPPAKLIQAVVTNPPLSPNQTPVPTPTQTPLGLTAAAPTPAPPAAGPPAAPPAHNAVIPVRNSLTLEAGAGRVIQLQANTTSVFAADPKVAEVRPASANSLFVFGVGPGRTTVAALDADGRPVAQYEVTVIPSNYASGAASGGISHVIPGHDISVDSIGNGVAVRGQAGSPAEAERAMAIARSYVASGQNASNRLNINANVQVNLRVRIAEMNRSITRSLGLNWSAMADIGKYATFSAATANVLSSITQSAFAAGLTKKGGVDAVLDALEQEGMVHSLAEPNLTAMSGETASFLVGGEFPIPVAQQNNQTTIDFKQYGVSLAFVPTVISDGHISLKVRPEVSQLTTTGAVTLSSGNSSFQVPALTVRRAETTVELGSGQSFAIAGLLQDASTISDTAVPFLGEVPILGALFRSDSYQRAETELVIIVTPYVVRPTSNPTALGLPTDGNPLPDDYERLLLLRSVGRTPLKAQTIAAPSSAGFVVQ